MKIFLLLHFDVSTPNNSSLLSTADLTSEGFENTLLIVIQICEKSPVDPATD